jgi:hypothetical protein
LVAPGPAPMLLNSDKVHLTCGGLVTGGGTSTIPEQLTPSGSTTRFGLSGCSGGACSVIGVADAGLPSGTSGSQTGSFFGLPIPRPNALSYLSSCQSNVYADDASGSIDLSTGDASLNVDLTISVWLTGNSTQPCPLCLGYPGTPGPGNPQTGTCDRGARATLTCTTINPAGLSNDCLPGGADGSTKVSDFGTSISPLATTTASVSDANGHLCFFQAHNGCFGASGSLCTSITADARPLGRSSWAYRHRSHWRRSSVPPQRAGFGRPTERSPGTGRGHAQGHVHGESIGRPLWRHCAPRRCCSWAES